MGTWETYKELEVPSGPFSPANNAGEKLKDDLTSLADRVPYLSTSDPSATDDSTDGFFAGSQWFNSSTEVMWVCIDATASSAVWRSLYKRVSGAIILCPEDSAGQRGLQMGEDGDARGTDAIDLQANRTASSQVAAGNYSVIAGGKANTIASGRNFAAIGGGEGNEIKTAGTHGFIGAGKNNDVTNSYSGVCVSVP